MNEREQGAALLEAFLCLVRVLEESNPEIKIDLLNEIKEVGLRVELSPGMQEAFGLVLMALDSDRKDRWNFRP